jgi:integrase
MGKRGSRFAAQLQGIEQRNAEIVGRYKAGEELASIGVDLDLTRERVRQIVRSAGARMPREYKCAVADCFKSPRAPQRYCFANQRRLDRGVLAVRGSLMGTARADMTIGTPKNGKARSVELGSIAVAALSEHRARQLEERKVIPLRGELGLVFCTEWGEYLPTNTIVLALHRVLARAGLPVIRFHDLRHTAATLMLREGVHPKMASEMLGHSTVAITLDLYSHITPTMQRQAADAIDRALTDPLVIGS